MPQASSKPLSAKAHRIHFLETYPLTEAKQDPTPVPIKLTGSLSLLLFLADDYCP